MSAEIQQEGRAEMVALMLELVRPGAEAFANVVLASGDARLDFRMGMGGERALTDLKILREVLQVVDGRLDVRVRGKTIDNPLMAGILGDQAAKGFGRVDGDGYRLQGRLKDGTMTLGDKPLPLMERFESALDLPIDWERLGGAVRRCLVAAPHARAISGGGGGVG